MLRNGQKFIQTTRFASSSLNSSHGVLQQRSFISVAQKWMEAYRRYGWRECLWKMYNPGDVKFGYLVGTDKFGTKYYEDPTQVAGQQRYCEFKFTHDPYDASQIPPEWHSWLHGFTDAKPGDAGQNPENWHVVQTSSISHAPYSNHLGPRSEHVEHLTGAHSRGYGVGSIMTSPDEPDQQYIQPNHVARKRKVPLTNVYDPEDPKKNRVPHTLRDLNLN